MARGLPRENLFRNPAFRSRQPESQFRRAGNFSIAVYLKWRET
jgi:hypothetical protein